MLVLFFCFCCPAGTAIMTGGAAAARKARTPVHMWMRIRPSGIWAATRALAVLIYRKIEEDVQYVYAQILILVSSILVIFFGFWVIARYPTMRF